MTRQAKESQPTVRGSFGVYLFGVDGDRLRLAGGVARVGLTSVLGILGLSLGLLPQRTQAQALSPVMSQTETIQTGDFSANHFSTENFLSEIPIIQIPQTEISKTWLAQIAQVESNSQESLSPETSQSASPDLPDGELIRQGLTTLNEIDLAATADRLTLIPGPEPKVVVGLLEAQAIALLNLVTGETEWSVGVGFAPQTVLYDPESGLIGAAGLDSSRFLLLEQDGAIATDLDLEAGVLDLAVDGETGRWFATHPDAQLVSVIIPAAAEIRQFPVPGPPLATLFNQATGKLLVTLGGNDPLGLLVLDPDTGQLEARFRTGNTPEAMALAVDEQILVILNSRSQDLSVLDLGQGGQLVQTIGLDWRPTRLALSPDGQMIYVTSRDSDRLQVVDRQQGQLVTTYRLGSQPTGILMADPIPQETGTESNEAGALPTLVVVEAGVPQVRRLTLPSSLPATVASQATGGVAGTVVDIADQPVSAGEIRLQVPGQTDVSRRLNLLPDGSFLMPDLPAGTYLADVTVPGYAPVTNQIQVRAGFVSTQTIRLPPRQTAETATGIGILPDQLSFSDELAATLKPTIEAIAPETDVSLLWGPLGAAAEFQSLLPLIENLTLIDRDQRYTADLERLQMIGKTLGLRYILLTHMETSRDFNRQGSPLLNLALQFLLPQVPVSVPNLTPNQLRSRGVVIVVDLQEDRIGDRIRYYEAEGRDDVGGEPMFEGAAAGLFRQQIRNMIPEFQRQWETASPFS